jgi:hypothetical protein
MGLMSFAVITLCVACQRVFIVVVFVVYFIVTQSGNFWIHPRIRTSVAVSKKLLTSITWQVNFEPSHKYLIFVLASVSHFAGYVA